MMESEFKEPYRPEESAYQLPADYWAHRRASLKDIAVQPAGQSPRSRPWWWLASGVAAALLIAFLALPSHQGGVDLSPLNEQSLENYLLSEFNYQANEEMLENENLELEWSPLQTIDDQKLNEYLNDNFDESLHYEYL